MRKTDLTSLKRVEETGLNLTVKSVKITAGHEGEPLHSCNIYKDNKKIAVFRELDWGGGSEVYPSNPKNQAVFDEVKKILESTKLPMDITEEEYEKLDRMQKFEKDWKFGAVTLESWAFEASVYQDLSKQAKRDIKKGYLSNDGSEFYIYTLKRGVELKDLQDVIRKQNKGICLFDMDDENAAIREYVKVFAEL